MAARTKRNTKTPLNALVASTVGPMSDRALSRLTTVSRETWVETCAGRRTPRLHVVQRIAQALGVDVATVLDAIEATFRQARAKRKAKP
jgi:hypothetical protein